MLADDVRPFTAQIHMICARREDVAHNFWPLDQEYCVVESFLDAERENFCLVSQTVAIHVDERGAIGQEILMHKRKCWAAGEGGVWR